MKMTRWIAMLLTLVMALSCACAASAEENPWAHLDLSKYEEINFYVIGTLGDDWQAVADKANELMIEKINTKVNFISVPWSDFLSMYSLYLSGDDSVDLIYTAPWCNYMDYVKAGALSGFDRAFVETWMPLTAKRQSPASWKEIAYEGKYYAVPNNKSDISVPAVAIPESILAKYGRTAADVQTLDALSALYEEIAAGEKGTGLYAFKTNNNVPMEEYWFIPVHHYLEANGGSATWMLWKYDTGKAFDVNDMVWFAKADGYLDYCLKMADFYKKGVFPANIISNTEASEDCLRAGTSASAFTSAGSFDTLQASTEEKLAFIDCFFDDTSKLMRGTYFGYGACFPSASTKKERAAVALDCMKNDPEVNTLLEYGFEGSHYILSENGKTYTDGPDASKWSYWCFLLDNDGQPSRALSDDMQAYLDRYEQAVAPAELFPIAGFVYDTSKYESEIAVIAALINEYRYSFNLGIFGDKTAEKYEFFIRQCENAKIDEIVADYRAQLSAYLAK